MEPPGRWTIRNDASQPLNLTVHMAILPRVTETIVPIVPSYCSQILPYDHAKGASWYASKYVPKQLAEYEIDPPRTVTISPDRKTFSEPFAAPALPSPPPQGPHPPGRQRKGFEQDGAPERRLGARPSRINVIRLLLRTVERTPRERRQATRSPRAAQ